MAGSNLLNGSDRSSYTTKTWDTPFNSAKAVNISNKNFFSVLARMKNCGHEKRPISCPCGKKISGLSCPECVDFYCGDQCAAFSKKKSTREGPERSPTTSRALKNDLDQFSDVLEVRSESVKSGSAAAPVASAEVSNGLTMEQLVKLNQRLRVGRGRGILRKSAPVEPGSLSNAKTCQIVEAQPGNVTLIHENVDKTHEDVATTAVAVPVDEFESAHGNVLLPFTIQKSLDCFEGDTFSVTHVYGTNLIHVVRRSVLKNEYLDLLDDVNDYTMDEPHLTEEPEAGTLVCAPYKSGIYHRAAVEKKLPDSQFLVRFLDFGGTEFLPLQRLKAFSSELYKVPLLGYKVLIRGVGTDLPLLSPRDFDSVHKAWLLKQKLKIEKVVKRSETLYEAIFRGADFNLADKILRFQIWDWEHLHVSGLRNDVEILEGKDWNVTGLLSLPLESFPTEPVMMQCCTIEAKSCFVTFKNFRVDKLQAEYKVLQSQIDRYASKVQPCGHFPAIGEHFLCRRAKGESWHRAARLDVDLVYCVDTDEIYENIKGLDSRRLCPEFLKVPAFSIRCMFAGLSVDEKLQSAVQKTFVEGKDYPVAVTGFDPVQKIYTVVSEALISCLNG